MDVSEDPDAFSKAQFEKFTECHDEIVELFSRSKAEKEVIELKDVGMNKIGKLFITLKQLNRNMQLNIKNSRMETQKKKIEIDQKYITLQNLLYEAAYLENETKKCLEYRSLHEDLDLSPVEEFMKNAPEKLTGPDVVNNEHQLMINRLQWELQERKELENKSKEVKKTTDMIARSIKKKKIELDTIKPKLDAVFEASKPLQEFLKMPLDKLDEEKHVTSLLPAPLYLLFQQFKAYCLIKGETYYEVKIIGNTEEAMNYHHEMSELIKCNEVKQLDGLTANNDDAEESESPRRKRSKVEVAVQSDKTGSEPENKAKHLDRLVEDVFRPHPLAVKFIIRSASGTGRQLEVMFHYSTILKIILVDSSVLWSEKKMPICAGDIFHYSTLFNALFPDDDGNPLKLLDVSQRLHQVDPSLLDKLKGIYETRSGSKMVYMWAQRLAGLKCISPSPGMMSDLPAAGRDSKPDVELSFSCLNSVLHSIMMRLSNRVGLLRELCMLEKGEIVVKENMLEYFPVQMLSKVSQWRSTTFGDILLLNAAKTVLQLELVNANCFVYNAMLTLGNTGIVIPLWVVVPHEYPVKHPVFILCPNEENKELPLLIQAHRINQGQTDKIRRNLLAFKNVQSEVNCYCDEFIVHQDRDDHVMSDILVCQVMRLQSSSDIMAEQMRTGKSRGDKAVKSVLVGGKFPTKPRPFQYSNNFLE